VTGWRRPLIKWGYYLTSYLLTILSGTSIKKTDKTDYDYSYYLGTDYKQTQTIPKNIPTYVCNHTAWTDVEILITQFDLAFAAKKSLRKVPVFGLLCTYLGCIFVSRGGSEEEKEKIFKQI